MKVIRIISTVVLSLFLGIAAFAWAQQEEKQDHPAQQQDKHDQAKPEQQQSQHAQQQKQEENKQTQQHAQEQQKQEQNKQTQQHAQQQQKQEQNKQTQQHAQQQRDNQQPQHNQEQQRVQQSAWQQHRANNWQSDHQTWKQRGGYNGYRIPDDRFRGYFGSNHGFHIYGLPFMVVGGYPRFQYQGYWISLVDPWPEYWGNDWYDNDDVYLAYVDNGYYLYNRRYPGVGIAISISM
jgi:hypothetical protein